MEADSELFLKPKSLEQRAEEEQNKVKFKQAKLQSEKLDRQVMEEKARRMQELKRLTA